MGYEEFFIYVFIYIYLCGVHRICGEDLRFFGQLFGLFSDLWFVLPV